LDPIGVEKSQKVDVTETKIGLGKVPGKLRWGSDTKLYDTSGYPVKRNAPK